MSLAVMSRMMHKMITAWLIITYCTFKFPCVLPWVGPVSDSQPATAGGGSGTTRNPLEFLRNQPQFQQMRQIIQQNPALLPALLQQLGRDNPQLLQVPAAPTGHSSFLSGFVCFCLKDMFTTERTITKAVQIFPENTSLMRHNYCLINIYKMLNSAYVFIV